MLLPAQAMTEDPANKERLYVTNEDIVGLASIGSDTVFAVTAPQGTSLVVPDPDANVELGQPRQYRRGACSGSPSPATSQSCCSHMRVRCCHG